MDREESSSVCRGTGTVFTSTSPPLEGARKTDMDRSALPPFQLLTEIHVLEVDQLYTLETPWPSQTPLCSPAHVCGSLVVAAISHICLPSPTPSPLAWCSSCHSLLSPGHLLAPRTGSTTKVGRKHGSEQVCYLRQLVVHRRALYSMYSTGG